MSATEAPLVFSTAGGLCVRYRGRLLYSDREPQRLPRRSASSCDRGPGRIHLAFSPALWYGLPELLAAMGPGSAVLCVEADPALAALARERVPETLLQGGRVEFVETGSPEEVLRQVRSMGRFRAVSSLALSGGEALNAPLYRRMVEAVAADIESGWRNRAALLVLGRRWARNLIDNLAFLPRLTLAPLPRFPGATLVCGAGPSLEAALPLISARRDRLSLVACDTAVGSLLQAGLAPDLVVCLEAQAHNLADFVPAGKRPLPLVADLSSHPATFRALAGPKHLSFVALTDSPFLERLRLTLDAASLPYRPMPPLGSVGVHALHLAREIAEGPVLAAGLDFSFEAGKTHARGSPSILAEERRLRRTSRWSAQYGASFQPRSMPAPCPPLPDGRRLRSDPILLSYAALVAQCAATRGPALFDIRGRGPAIGAAPLDLDRADALLAASPPRPQPQPGSDAAAGAPGPIAAFLREERGRLETLRAVLKGRRSMEDADFAALLAEVDYLYWSFPDADRVPKLPRDLLNRLLPELEFWSWRLDSAIAAIGD